MSDTVKSLVDLIATVGPEAIPGLAQGDIAYRQAITPGYQQAWETATTGQAWVKSVENFARGTNWANMVNKYKGMAGSNLLYALQREPVLQPLFGAGIGGARNIFEAAATAVNPAFSLEGRAKQQAAVFNHAAELSAILLERQAVGGAGMAAIGGSMGFSANMPGTVASEMMLRGDIGMRWDPRGFGTREVQLRSEAARVHEGMLMLRAGRGLFGNIPGREMFQKIENFFGVDTLHDPKFFMNQMRDLAEITRAGTITPEALMGTPAGAEGPATGHYAFRQAFAAGGVPRKLASMQAVVATKDYGLSLAALQRFSGQRATRAQLTNLSQTTARREYRRSTSTAGRALQMVEHYHKKGMIDPESYKRIERAAKFGNAEEMERAIQDASLSVFGDRRRLQNISNDPRAFNYEMERMIEMETPQEAQEATEAAMEKTAGLEQGELRMMEVRERADVGGRQILRAARAGGVRLDVEGAHMAGLARATAKLKAGELPGGVSKERQAMAGATIESMKARGMSSAEIWATMRKSTTFTGLLKDIQTSAIKGAKGDLARQFGKNKDHMETFNVAKQYFSRTAGIEGASEAEGEVAKLLAAGDIKGAQRAMKNFAAEHGALAPDIGPAALDELIIDTKEQAARFAKGMKAGEDLPTEGEISRYGDYKGKKLQELEGQRKTFVKGMEETARARRKKTVKLEEGEVGAPTSTAQQDDKAQRGRDRTQQQVTGGSGEAIRVVIVGDERTPRNLVALNPEAGDWVDRLMSSIGLANKHQAGAIK